MLNKIELAITELRQKKPLVLCLTNNVTMEFVANCLLALGAAPIMSDEPREFEELVQLSNAIYINIGTLNTQFVANAKILAQLAQKYTKPLILDPVGAGASSIRTETAANLAPFADVIRGNASEIIALSGALEKPLGVESRQPVDAAKNYASELATKYHCVVAVSGPEDFITNGKENEILQYGSPIMSKITGMGCSLTAVIAAFCGSSSNNFFVATQLAVGYFGLCGSAAAKKTSYPGSFRVAFIDTLNEMNLC